MTTTTRFEDRLLEQLRHVVAERPAPDAGTAGTAARPRPRPRARLALAAGGVAAALAVAAIVATSSGVTPSAYAVETRPDGSVTVKIHSLGDAPGLERSLRAAGVPAVVDYLRVSGGSCATQVPASGPTETAPSGTASAGAPGGSGLHTEHGTSEGPRLTGPGPAAGEPGAGAGIVTSRVSVGDDGATFTIDPGKLKPGEHVFIGTSTGAMTSIATAVGKHAPTGCAPTPAAGR